MNPSVISAMVDLRSRSLWDASIEASTLASNFASLASLVALQWRLQYGLPFSITMALS